MSSDELFIEALGYPVGHICDLAIHKWNYCHTSFFLSEQTYIFENFKILPSDFEWPGSI